MSYISYVVCSFQVLRVFLCGYHYRGNQTKDNEMRGAGAKHGSQYMTIYPLHPLLSDAIQFRC